MADGSFVPFSGKSFRLVDILDVDDPDYDKKKKVLDLREELKTCIEQLPEHPHTDHVRTLLTVLLIDVNSAIAQDTWDPVDAFGQRWEDMNILLSRFGKGVKRLKTIESISSDEGLPDAVEKPPAVDAD